MNGPERFREELGKEYAEIRGDIEERMDDFSSLWEERDHDGILRELFFCILTPQSRAQTCWGAVEDLTCRDLLFGGSYEEVLESVGVVRFKYRKASYIIEARGRFVNGGNNTIVEVLEEFDSPFELRDWLVKNIKGYGYKEASHFMRNIGLGSELAILDRHILKNLVRAGVIDEVPSSVTEKKYKEIEGKMRSLSEKMDIPMSHLDLLLWYRETGSIFK